MSDPNTEQTTDDYRFLLSALSFPAKILPTADFYSSQIQRAADGVTAPFKNMGVDHGGLDALVAQ